MRKSLLLALPIFFLLAVSVFALVQFDRSVTANTSSIEQVRVINNPRTLSDEELRAVPEGEPGKGLFLRMTATGMEPAEVTLTAGQYYLLVQNASGRDQFTVRVERENGERLHNVNVERYQRKWKQVLNLSPGRYIISEPDHPRLTCRIEVTSR